MNSREKDAAKRPHHVLRLELRQVVLLLVQEVLDLLLVDLDLGLVALLGLLQVPVLHPRLRPALLQLLLRHLPEDGEPVALQLVVVALLSLSVKL